MHDIGTSDAAFAEVVEAKEWYRLGSLPKARRFETNLNRALEQLRTFPESGERIEGTLYRRLLVTGFPYFIVYAVEPGRIQILALAHTSRDPESWRARLSRPD